MTRRSDQELLDGLHRAKVLLGEPLSRMGYRRVAPSLGLAADMTIVKRFGSFPEALRRAGIEGYPSVGRRQGSVSKEDALAAVLRCVEAHGGERVSYRAYCSWAAQNEAPSGPMVRVFWSWNEVMNTALEAVV